jgi:hypothetical protein
MITFIEAIVAVGFALLLIRLVWNDGYSSGQNCMRRAQIRETNAANKQVGINNRRIHGLDNRVDGIEARLASIEVRVAKLEHLDATFLYANGDPYMVVDTDVESPYKDPRCDTCQNKDEGLACTACHDGGCYMKKEEAE